MYTCSYFAGGSVRLYEEACIVVSEGTLIGLKKRAVSAASGVVVFFNSYSIAKFGCNL